MQLELFEDKGNGEISLEDVFEAYFECRRNKRRTANALAFEADYESRLIELWKDINSGVYQPGKSIAFIVTEPVKREVFAADFRDRVVHHLIIRKLNPLFEARFIEDSYSCREGKGTQYGIGRVASFIRECSENYTKDCYILKMDIQSFFMSIDKGILFKYLKEFILNHYFGEDKNLIVDLVEKVVFNAPEDNCLIKGRRSDWIGLPASKSLFTVAKNKGMPIGNLTSQIFANFYLNFFDRYVKDECGVKYYGRYVDDFVIVHPDKEYLLGLKENLKTYIYAKLRLRLHPKKVYLQHYTKGVKFIGAVIKPGREYIGNRTKGNFYAKIIHFNREWDASAERQLRTERRQQTECSQGGGRRSLAADMLASINSYLGFMIHYKTFKIRRKMLEKYLLPIWKRYVYVGENLEKIVLKERYKPMPVKLKKLRRRKCVSGSGKNEAFLSAA